MTTAQTLSPEAHLCDHRLGGGHQHRMMEVWPDISGVQSVQSPVTRPLITEQRLDIDCRGLMGTRDSSQSENIAQILSFRLYTFPSSLEALCFLLNICEILN